MKACCWQQQAQVTAADWLPLTGQEWEAPRHAKGCPPIRVVPRSAPSSLRRRGVLLVADELDVTLEAVFITHAHADHFGGAYLLQRRAEVPLYAPALEAAMMENPIIEPLYLFGGASPIKELRNKFTLAKPCRVDHVVEEPGVLEIGPFQVEVIPLPGHPSAWIWTRQ